MMNRNIYLFTLLLQAALFTSCSSDDATLGGDDSLTPILLSGSSTAVVSQGAVSRAEGTTAFATGQTVGVFIHENTQDVPLVTYEQNLQFTAASGGALSYTDEDTDTPYYPQNGNGVTISAYSPYNSSWESADSYPFTVKSDQSSDDNYTASDLLFSASANYAKKSSAHTLTFDHKLSRLSYTLAAGTGLTAGDLSGATVKFINLSSSVNVHLSSGELSNLGTANSSIIPHADYGAIAPPQTVTAGTQLMEITIGNRPYYYVPASAITLVSGKHTTFTITVNQTGISVEYSVSNWETGTVDDDSPVASEYERTYKVGDYYPDPDVDLTDAAAKAAIQGVVYWIDPDATGYDEDSKSGPRGKIVSLENLKYGDLEIMVWGSYDDDTDALDTGNGLANMATITKLDNWSTSYPAFSVVHALNDQSTDYSSGATGVWYLPAIAELQHLLCAAAGEEPETWGSWSGSDNKQSNYPSYNQSDYPLDLAAFNGILTAAGGTGLSNSWYYWSSTESTSGDAWAVKFENGNTINPSKISSLISRAVSAF